MLQMITSIAGFLFINLLAFFQEYCLWLATLLTSYSVVVSEYRSSVVSKVKASSVRFRNVCQEDKEKVLIDL